MQQHYPETCCIAVPFLVINKTACDSCNAQLQAKKAQLVAKRDEDEWGTGELGEDLLPQ